MRKKEVSDYSKKLSSTYLIPPTDTLLQLIQPFLPAQFDKATLNSYLIIIDRLFVAQFKCEIVKKEAIISNLILTPTIESDQLLQRIINTIEMVGNFAKESIEKMTIP